MNNYIDILISLKSPLLMLLSISLSWPKRIFMISINFSNTHPLSIKTEEFVTHAHLTHDFLVDYIINNDLQKNLIENVIVKKIHLPMDPHPRRYALRLKDNGLST